MHDPQKIASGYPLKTENDIKKSILKGTQVLY